MKLCFLGDVRSIHVQKFIKYFSEKYDTYLISFDYIGDERTEIGQKFFNKIGTQLHLIKKSHILISPIITRNIIKKINPDLVHAHFVTNYGFLGAFSGAHPLVISAIGDDVLIHPFTNKFYNKLVIYALNEADVIICDGVNSTLNIKNFGIPEDKISLIYYGIDMDLFYPYEKTKSKTKTVFYPRGFDKIYDTDTLFSVMKIINKQHPEVIFDLLGIGTELNKFRKRVLNSDLWASVRYLGYIQNNELPEYLASVDVSVSTSLSDSGCPVSIIESMACGIPVVSTDVGDAKLWIKDGESGYVTNKRDAEEIAKRIIELLNDDEKRLQFGKNARQTVEKSQNYKLEMEKVEKIYMKLLGGN